MSGTTESVPRTEAATRMPGPQRRRQLLANAREHFARHGFHHTTMEDIAESSQVSKPVLYQHFSGKDDLYGAVLDSGIELFENQVITPLLADMDNRTRAREMIANFIDVVINDRDTYRIIFQSDMKGDQSVADKIDGLVARVSQRLAQTLRDNSTLPAEDCAFLAQTLVGLATSAASVVSSTEDTEKQLRQQLLLFKLAWRGIENIGTDWV